MDMSVNIPYTPFRFEPSIYKIQMQGLISQNCDLGLSFYFMKCRNLYCTNDKKLPVFGIIKNLGPV